MSREKYLIVNADDFGLNSNVNQAVLSGFLKGCLTSTSLFSVAPDNSFKEAVEILKNNQSLDFGIQIVLSSCVLARFKPLSKKTPLASHGFFYKNPLQWAWVLSQKKFTSQVEIEMRKQIEKVLKTGLTPSHLNSHYYVTELPGLTELLVNLAQEYKIKAVRNPYEVKSFLKIKDFKLERYFISQIIKILSCSNRKKILKKKLMTSDYYYGVAYSGRMNVEQVLIFLENLEPGINELLLHPSLENSSHFRERDEYEVLISNKVKQSIKKNNIVLTSYRELKDKS